MPPARASAFATALLWYDAAGASDFGIGSLPDWLDAIARGEFDPKAEPWMVQESPATAVLDAGRAIGPVVFARAAEVAQQKAREVGVGLVRIAGLAGSGSAAAAAMIAVGPMVATVQGPGAWTIAVPVAETVPAVFDSAIAGGKAAKPAWPGEAFPAWAAPFSGEAGWLVSAYAVRAFEPLETFHERLAGLLAGAPAGPGEVRPEDWRRRREEMDGAGLAPSKATLREFERLASAAGVAAPVSVGSEAKGRSA